MDSLNELWEIVAGILQKKMSDAVYNVWIKDIVPVSFDDGVVTLAIGEFKRKIIEQKFFDLITDAFQQALGFSVAVNFESPVSSALDIEAQATTPAVSGIYNEENTFDTFVVGSSNKFAHAAALAVASNPGGAYNPLFIYGKSGLGKTHLLSAIAYEIKKNDPSLNIVLTNCEAFTNELVYYIAKKDTREFHKKYRYADVFLMDDIQFVMKKETTQEELFYTFNALIEAGKQVVLTSDRPPKDIVQLEERLRTRFEWGLIADIQPPDLETRMAIVKRKAEALDVKLTDDVVQYIAEKLKNNIRQLEGAVKKICAVVAIHDTVPNMATVQNAIKDILSEERPDPITIERVVEEVARTYGANAADIYSKKRDARTSRMRQIAMYVVSETTHMSTQAIGDAFGGRDHSTVVYALQEIRRVLARDSSLNATVKDIIKNVQESD
ncbi:MAG: chromosomal replication initiator protein DnaA [Clostridiales bacterium]|nr:chromosomal replication initiator protein DnaA [Clostridiales bacterium]